MPGKLAMLDRRVGSGKGLESVGIGFGEEGEDIVAVWDWRDWVAGFWGVEANVFGSE